MTQPPGSITVLRERYGDRYRWLLLLSVMVGTMASIMSSTIVNVAIPDMSHYFMLGQERAQWVTSGFMVATTVSMLTTPWLLSRYGYRATYVGAMVLLLAGGIAGGLSGHFGLVLAARVAEGLAAGVVQPIPAVIILYAFKPHEQGRASGIFGMGVVLAPAIGPSVGGLLVDWFGWRSIFFMVVPFCLASIALAYKFVPTTAPGGVPADRRGEPLDWRGLMLGTLGTLCLLNGLVAMHSGPYAQAALLMSGAILFFVLFLWWQRRVSRRGLQPLMDLRVFSYRQFAMGSVVAFIYGTALFGSTYLLPVFMQLGLQLSASHVGTIMLPSGIVLAMTIPLVGRLADRVPTHWLVSTGLALLGASFALMMLVGLQSALWMLVLFAVLGRIGLGFILPSLNLGAMRPLDKTLISQGSSVIGFVRMLGGRCGREPLRNRAGMAFGRAWRFLGDRRHQRRTHRSIWRNLSDAGRALPARPHCRLAVAGCTCTDRRTLAPISSVSTPPDLFMCQLLGMNSNTPTDITFSFRGFAQRGGNTADHADGWGIAFFEDRGLRHFVDHQPAANSPIAELIRGYPIKSFNVIAHIRKATQGPVSLQNCHPFVRELWGRYWVFAHNGDLKEFRPRLHAHFHPVGTTDSEHAFCWLLQELAKSHAGMPSIEELTHTLRELAPHIAKHGTFNFLLSNGEALWAHASTHLYHLERRHPFAVAQLSDEDLCIDFAPLTTPSDRVQLVATEPLTTNEGWKAFGAGELKVFVHGTEADMRQAT